MNVVFFSVAAVSAVILILVAPFKVKSHTAFSLKRLFVVENVNLFGFVSVALSLRLQDGKLYFNDKKFVRNRADKKSKQESSTNIMNLIKDFQIVSIEVRGAFGNAVDAAASALISSAIIMICGVIKNTMFSKLKKFKVLFVPIYQRNIFDIDVKIKVKVNILLIILTILRILWKR